MPNTNNNSLQKDCDNKIWQIVLDLRKDKKWEFNNNELWDTDLAEDCEKNCRRSSFVEWESE